MKNSKNLFEKLFNRQYKPYYTPIILGGIALVLFFIFISLQNRQVKPANQQSYQDIYPGTTTIQEAIKKLGQPISTIQEGNQTIYKFDSRNKYYPHEVRAVDNQVQLVTQELTDKPKDNQIEKYTNLLKQPPITLYNEESLIGFHLYVWPANGIAIKASENKGIGLYILYFPPTTLENFIHTYAPDYSTTFNQEQFPHGDVPPESSPSASPLP